MAIVRLVDKRTGEEVLDGDMVDVATGESQAIAAARLGNVGDLKLLYERHANFNYQDPDGWTALMTVCATHHVDCALYLISCGVNLELAAKDGWTALMIAIDHNQEEIVKALLDAGAKTGRFNYSGACELCIAAKYPRLAELLLEHGVNPNQPHPKLPLVTPLFLTLSHCKDAHPDFVRALVKHGAEINAQTKEGQTPLMVSVMNADITKVLLECGADPLLQDQDGETALDYAQKPGVDPMAYEILNKAMQKQDKDIERKDDTAIDEKVSLAEAEKNGTNGSIFTSETNCTINIDDIKSLTIFCDKYGAILTVGDTQLIAWYKVDIKAGKQAKGDYAFDGFAYISGKDFLRLKPILLKRGWEFHSAKSGSPWFAEGESAVCPKEVEVMSQTLSDGQSINNGIDKGSCVVEKEDIGESVAPDKPQSSKDEKRAGEKNSANRGCLFWLCLISVSAIVGCAVWLLKDGLLEVFSESFSRDQNKEARQGDGQELRNKVAKTQHEIEERRTSEQEERFRNEAEQTRIEHEVQMELEQAARIKREEEEKRLLEQQQALQKQLKHKEIAEQQKGQMIVASQSAKKAGAKVYAVSKWNNGIAAWKLGDDMFKTKSYELARGHYSEAANYFKAAELTASKVEAKNLLASLPDLEMRAVNLIRDNERWFKWSVDASALVSMGNELCKEYKKVELLVSKGVLANFGDTKSKLANLILRCYELAADAGNTVAMLTLAYWSENGKMCPKNSEKAVEWYVKAARAKNGDAMYRLGYFYSEGLMGLEKSKEKSYLMFRSAKVNGCTFKNVDAWLNSLPNRNPRGYKVFLWGGMNVELDIDDLLDEIEARVK